MKSWVDTRYIYQVVAEREGDFTIPSVSLRVDGKTYSTQPIALKVKKGSTGGTSGSGSTEGSIAFAEIDVEKKTRISER
jgi:hypothetical protein